MDEKVFAGFGTEAVLASAALALAWGANLSVAGSDALLMHAGDTTLPVAGAAGITSALLIGGFAPRLIRNRMSRRAACVISALLCLLFAGGALALEPGSAVPILSGLRFSFGLGIGCLLVMAAAPLMEAPRLPSALATTGAFLAGTIAYLLVENVSSPLDIAVSTALAVLACLVLFLAPEEDEGVDGCAGSDTGSASAESAKPSKVPRGFWPLALGLTAYSIVYGIAITITLALGEGAAHLTPIKLVLLVPAIVTGALLFRFRDSFDFRRFQWFLFLPSVVALLPLPFVDAQIGLAFCGVLVLVFGFYDLASFILLLDLGRTRPWHVRVRVFAWGRAANTAGMLIGWLLASHLLAGPLAGAEIERGDIGMVSCAFTAVGLLVLAMTCFGSPALAVEPADRPREGRWKRACRAVAERGRLSPRETEVFELLAKGNGTERIAEELFIAVPTVKTHSYRLYQKLGVHSQQELIDLVEAAKSALPR